MPSTLTENKIDVRASHLETAMLAALDALPRSNAALLEFFVYDGEESMKDISTSAIINHIMDGKASEEEKSGFKDLVRMAQETWYCEMWRS